MGISMHVISWDTFIARDSPRRGTAMTIGVFDGVHLGHQTLIRKIAAMEKDLTPTVITFLSNPKYVLYPELFRGNIISLKQKLEILESFHISQAVLIDFSGNFSKLGGREFIDTLRIRGNLRYLVIGSNFRCGHKLDTNAALIKEINAVEGIPTEVVEPVTAGNEPVSSSRIRTAILSGDLVGARALLGRNFKIDVSSISITPGNGGIFFNVAASGQISPPDGRYPVLLFPVNSDEGIKTDAVIDNGIIFIPSDLNTDSIEFI